MEKMNSQMRILEEIKVLYENHVSGLSNKALAEKVGTTAVNMCRDIAILESYKWVSRDSKGRWRLSAEFGGIAGQIMKSYKVARLNLADDEIRYAKAMQ